MAASPLGNEVDSSWGPLLVLFEAWRGGLATISQKSNEPHAGRMSFWVFPTIGRTQKRQRVPEQSNLGRYDFLKLDLNLLLLVQAFRKAPNLAGPYFLHLENRS